MNRVADKKTLAIIAALALMVLTVVIFVSARNTETIKSEIYETGNAVAAPVAPKQEEKEIESVQDGADLKSALAGRQVYFSGLEDSIIDSATPVFLENLPENGEILMKYRVTNQNTGEVIFKSDMISSGSHAEWIPGETLPAGEYCFSIHATPYFPFGDGEDGFVSLTAADNVVYFTIQ